MEQRHSYSSPIRHSVASEDYLAGYHELRRGADYPRDSVPLLVPRTPLQHAQGGHKDAGATSGWGISSVAKDLFSNNKQPVRLNDNVPGSTISNPISLEQWQSMQAAGSTIVNPISLEQWRSTQAALGPRAKQHWQPPHLGPPMPPEHKSSLPQSAQYRPLPEVEHRPALKNEANSSHPVSMVSPENDQMLALTADSQRMCSQIAASMKNIDDLLTVSCRADMQLSEDDSLEKIEMRSSQETPRSLGVALGTLLEHTELRRSGSENDLHLYSTAHLQTSDRAKDVYTMSSTKNAATHAILRRSESENDLSANSEGDSQSGGNKPRGMKRSVSFDSLISVKFDSGGVSHLPLNVKEKPETKTAMAMYNQPLTPSYDQQPRAGQPYAGDMLFNSFNHQPQIQPTVSNALLNTFRPATPKLQHYQPPASPLQQSPVPAQQSTYPVQQSPAPAQQSAQMYYC